MDKIVSVSRSFLNEIRGFLNIYAGVCKGCLRKTQIGCIGCDGLRATLLIKRIDNLRDAKEEQYYIEHPDREYEDIVIKAIEQAGKPIAARQIKMNGIPKAKKNLVITNMVRKGFLAKTPVNGSYEYSIKRKPIR